MTHKHGIPARERDMLARNKVFTMGAACSALLSATLCAVGAAAQAPSAAFSVPSGALRAEAVARSLRAAERLRKSCKVEGLSLAVVDSTGPVWTAGAGSAEPGKAFGPGTLSFPGSVSKLFTASAVMLLVERGLVDLDAPLSRYLPEFTVRAEGWSPESITVRSLLTHSSGLPSDLFRGMVKEESPSGAYPPAPTAAELPALLAEEYAARPPFTAFAYSNLGYSLLGTLVERVSGASLRDFMESEIFGPLGMASSVFDFGPEELGPASPG
ncbi:MAG: beta-lactamase family protein, partial [Spirochaetaceae bacterium]|nr:beta-lactamase family protein [Spirochaetaceae bacterium]